MPFNHDDADAPPSGGDWVKGPLSARSTPAEIDAYISAHLRDALENLRGQLEADEVLNFKNRPRDRAAVLVRC